MKLIPVRQYFKTIEQNINRVYRKEEKHYLLFFNFLCINFIRFIYLFKFEREFICKLSYF